MSLTDYKGVWVFAEQLDKKVKKVSLELLGEGRRIADELGTTLTAVLLGDGVKGEAETLIKAGANEVYVIEDKRLDLFTTEPYTKVLTQIINEKKPEIVLVGATALGRDLAPRVSARIHTGLTADCTTLAVDEETKNLLMTRPAFGGNIMATIVCPDHRPQMATVRGGVMKTVEMPDSHTGNVYDYKVDLTDADVNVEILEVVKEDKEIVDIADSRILVSGGRGVGSKENFAKLDELAEVLDGTVCCSRAVVDAGIFDHTRQVGQTGTTVRPELYIACGISGAIQHVAGMESSEFIVAINKNSTAPIFEVADLGIIGDVNAVIPALTEELKAYKAAQNKK